MGRMINPYEKPLSREDYQYLKVREEQFKISENIRHFGPLGKVEGHEWEDEEDGPVHEGAEEVEELEDDSPDYDPDDVTYVDSIGYGEHQRLLKAMNLRADGDKATVRQRLLDAIKERGGIQEVVEFEDDGSDGGNDGE